MAQLKEAQPETVQSRISSVTDIQSHRLRSSSNNRPKVEGRSFDNEIESNEQETFFQLWEREITVGHSWIVSLADSHSAHAFRDTR